MRDIALAASGLLDPKLGGPSVYPPAPDFLFQPPASYGPKVWPLEPGSERYRRALYTFRFRSVPYPVLQTFDAPNGDFSCVRRARSNTPLQALVTLNEPVFLECARALARQVVAHGGSDSEQVVYAFRRCLAQPAHGIGSRRAGAIARPATGPFLPAGRQPLGTGRRRFGQSAPIARRRQPGSTCRLDRGFAGAAEFGRDDHERMIRGPRTSEPKPMNCQDPFYRGADPTAVARRWFLKECGVGLGAVALASCSVAG